MKLILSHKYRFIFLKTQKTAGTSIEIALSKYLGEKDIITKITKKDEKIRRNLKYRGPQNYYPKLIEYSIYDYLILLKRKKRKYFYNHINAAEIKEQIPRRIWNSYFKFCFERNPWDKVISHYYWKNKSDPRPPISDFIKSNTLDLLKYRGYHVYTINGLIAVDRVFLYEDIENEIEKARTIIGLPEKLTLPKAKADFRKKGGTIGLKSLSIDDINHIRNKFCQEIDLFNYDFPYDQNKG